MIDLGDLSLLPHRDDYYAIGHRIREVGPIVWSEQLKAWIIASHDIARSLLNNKSFSKAIPQQRFGTGPLARLASRWILFLDPPDHTEFRGIIEGPWNAIVSSFPREAIYEHATKLIRTQVKNVSFDFMSCVAYPVAIKTVSDIIGLPSGDVTRFAVWSRGIAAALDPVPTSEAINTADSIVCEIESYLESYILSAGNLPETSLLRSVINGSTHSTDPLHLVRLASLVLLAGFETTANAIGNGLLALLQNPDEYERARRMSPQLRTVVDEILRFDPSVQFVVRQAPHDVDICGMSIRKGQTILPWIGFCNRDPNVFSNPDTLQVARTENRHLSFGGGIHRCLGGNLATIELEEVFRAILAVGIEPRFNGVAPRRRNATNLRGLERLVVARL